MGRREKEGAITIFLSLIIVLMLAIVCSTVEATRMNIAKIQVERVLNTAMNAVLAEYDKDLLEHYGLMSLDSTYGTSSVNEQQMVDRLNYYAQRALLPQQSLPPNNIIYQSLTKKDEGFLDLYRFKVKGIELNNFVSLPGENGQIFKNQILEYMKYRGPLLLLEEFLEKLDLVSKSAKTSEVIQEKIKIEERVQEVGDHYYYLMTLIDGIEYAHGKLQINNGSPQITLDSFVKQLIVEQDAFPLANHEEVDRAIRSRGYYIQEDIANVGHMLSKLFDHAFFKYYLEEEIANKEDEIASIGRWIEKEVTIQKGFEEEEKDLRQQLKQATNPSHRAALIGKIEEVVTKAQDIEQGIQEYIEEQDQLKGEVRELDTQRKEEEELFNATKSYYFDTMITIKTRLLSVRQKNEDALLLINEIIQELEEAKGIINAYETRLENNREELIEQTYRALYKDIGTLKAQLGIHEEATLNLNPFGNIQAMAETLEGNLLLLDQEELLVLEECIHPEFFSQLELKAKSMAFNSQGQGISKNIFSLLEKEDLLDLFEKIRDYSIDALAFDYRDLRLVESKEPPSDPRANEDLKTSEVDFSEYDKSKELKDELPSYEYKNEREEAFDSKVDFLSSTFSSEALEILSSFGSTVSDLPKTLLVNEYIIGNFQSSIDHLEGVERLSLTNYPLRDHYLNYEIEYILEGSPNELQNLQGVSNKIILVRFALNLVHILSDPIKRQAAFGLASAIIGWSPLAFLVYVVQFLIMCAWSYGEAYVDIKLLREGYRVAFIKTKGDWVLDLKGLINFGVTTVTEEITKKAETLIEQSVEKAQEIVNNFGQQVSNGVKSYTKEQLSWAIDEAYTLGNEALEYIDRQVEEVLDQLLVAAQKGEEFPKVNIEILCDDTGRNLVEEILQEVAQHRETLVDARIVELLSVKEKIRESLEDRIVQAKDRLLKNIDHVIEEGISEVKESINGQIEAGAEKVEAYLKENINEISRHLKEELNKNVNDEVSKSIKTEKDEGFLSHHNIKFSYVDYLRIFLLFQDEGSKLYRTMDCIQMNMQQKRGDSFRLNQGLFAFDANIEVEMPYLFFNLPFMPEQAKKLGKTKHTISVTLSNSY